MRKKGKAKILSLLLAMVMLCTTGLSGVQLVRAEALENQAGTMEITEDDLNSNEYETYYYADNLTYTYQGEEVKFLSETQFTAGGETYDLKNAKTEITVDQAEDGNVTIKLTNLTTPVGQIQGEWNSTWAGSVEMVYQTDISGMEEVRSKSGYPITSSISLGQLEDGTYHLTGGTIYEKANSYSPGHDFGNGTATEAYFGTLPDITFTVGDEEEDTEVGTQKLKDIQVTGGELSPGFTSDNSFYTLYVQEETESVVLNPVVFSSKTEVSISVDGEDGSYQAGDAIPVLDGKTVRVTGTYSHGMGSSSKSYLLTFDVVKDSESGYGFDFSLDGEGLKMKEDGSHEDGTTYLKVEIPQGTQTIQIQRSRVTQASSQGDFSTVIFPGGIGTANLDTASYIGKENYFILTVDNTDTYYVYLKEVEEIDESLPSMEITQEDLNANEYETYYHSSGVNYYYQGAYVIFTDEEHFTADDQTYGLKNKKVAITQESSDGTIRISMDGLKTPVGSISGKWNSYGGAVQIVYQTDIPGMEEVRSSDLKSLTLEVSQVANGTYHLTGGTIYEKANAYSPGYDFGNGTVTEAYFGTLPDLTITVDNPIVTEEGYIGTATEAKVYDDFENDIWLQYQQKQMQVGDTASLYPWRCEQIVSNTITNDVQRPTFHFEIISGDSVSLDTEASNEKAFVTAEKPGTSVVKVTYDALDYNGLHWDAISPVNTAYAVYTVGETGKASITLSEELENWRHYDTIYYAEGETVPYTFTVDTENAESVQVTVNGLEIQGDGNQYTANLENRSNIIGVVAKDSDGNTTSKYKVVDARFIEIQVQNKTNPDEALKAGDTANISFRGITMPIYKLATIYNPQYGGGTKVIYKNDILGTFEGTCSQWDLATNNDFDVTFEEGGDYTFYSDEGIFCKWWGSNLGADITAEGSGEPNLNAPTLQDNFSFLPDFTVSVEGKAAVESITLDKESLEMEPGDEETLTATILPEEAADQEVTWSSSNEAAATVEGGKVTAVAAGEAQIKASAGGKEAICTVTVKEAEPKPEITASTEPEKIYPGTEVTITFANLEDPETGTPTRQLQTRYSTDIPGLESVASADAAEDTGKLKTICFTVPEDTQPGEYHLTDGYVYKEWGGYYIQGSFLTGVESGSFYEEEMPEIIIQVSESDETIAGKVTDQINGLKPAEELTLADEADIVLAREAYDALTEEQKAFVTDETLQKLADAEAKIAQLKQEAEDQKAADEAAAKIEALKSTEELTLDDQAAVEEARASYEALTDSQKVLVSDDVLQKLLDAEEMIQKLQESAEEEDENQKAAQAVINRIMSLGAAADLTLDDEAFVAEVRADYEALTDAQKELVTNLSDLEAAEARIQELKQEAEGQGTVTFSIEKFTIGQGFFTEPVELQFNAGETVEQVFARYMEENGFGYAAGGSGATFYLQSIEGADTTGEATLPSYITETFGDIELTGNADDSLGEFDYYNGSGWYYFVNNTAPEVGMGSYALEDGDVIRIRFTLLWGQDLTGYDMDGNQLIALTNMDEGMKALAEVNSSPENELLLSDEAVWSAYENLYSLVQNAVEPQENIDEAAALLREAVSNVRVNQVAELINALPAYEDLTLEDEQAVIDARKAYNRLSEEEKLQIGDLYEVLKAAENRISELKNEDAYQEEIQTAAQAVIDQINSLKAAEELTLDDKAAVEAAREAYNGLNADARALVENYEILVNAEAKIQELEQQQEDQAAAQAVTDQIYALKGAEDLTLEDKGAVEEARAAYEALTDAQKALVSEETLAVLEKAEAAIQALEDAATEEEKDQAAAQAVIDQIQALKGAEDLTLEDKTAVAAAREAYNALTDTQKALVPEDTLKLLEEAEAAIQALEDAATEDEINQAAAQAVIDQIHALKGADSLTLDDKAAVQAAREAYDALTDEQKARIPEDTLKLLEEAEAAIQALEDAKGDDNQGGNNQGDDNQGDDNQGDDNQGGNNQGDDNQGGNNQGGNNQGGNNQGGNNQGGSNQGGNNQGDNNQDDNKQTGETTLTYKNYPISVTGEGLEGCELVVEALTAEDEDVKRMQGETPSDQALIRLYNVKLMKDGKEIQPEGSLKLNIQLGTQYEGKTLTVLHVVDGKVEKLTGTVKDGVVTVTVDRLGKFGVIVDVKANGNDKNSDNTSNTNTNGQTSSGSKTAGSGSTSKTSSSDSVKTGDDTQILPYILLMLVALGAGGAALYRRKKVNK